MSEPEYSHGPGGFDLAMVSNPARHAHLDRKRGLGEPVAPL